MKYHAWKGYNFFILYGVVDVNGNQLGYFMAVCSGSV